MLQVALDFVRANWAILSVFIVNEIIAISPTWASGSIGQFVINAIRMFLQKPPISIEAPKK